MRIIVERRGSMYDPVVVDAFLASHHRIMPGVDSARHPAAQVIGEARWLDREEQRVQPAVSAADAGASDGLLAVTSLSRAVSGEARVADVGALMWMVVRQLVPCDAMALFLPDATDEARALERIDATVKQAADLGFLRELRNQPGHWEVRRILKAYVDAQTLSDFAGKLAEYNEAPR